MMEQTEQQRLEQLEHCRVQEEQASLSHWEHGVLDPLLFWHTQQPVEAADAPTQKEISMSLQPNSKVKKQQN